MEKKIYDVCNDHSLELTETVPVNGTVRWIKRNMVISDTETIEVELGYSRKHKELHYLRADSNIDKKLLKIRYITE